MRASPSRRATAAFFLLWFILAQVACAGPIPIDVLLDRGETLRVRGAQPTTLDPSLAGDAVSWSYLLHIFSGLVRLNDRLEVVPDLAERWQISPDGRTYTFTLRQDARFHSGRAVTSADFKYAMERALARATGSTVAQQYLGDIVGAAELASGTASDVRGIRTPDPQTLEIDIDAPKTYFLAKLTYPTASALDRANVESGPNWFERPDGTGPFRLSSWERESKLVLTRFNQHWTGPARIRSVEFNLTPIPGIVQYELGDVDVTEVDLDSLDRVSDPSNPLSRDLVVTPLLSTWYLGMNTSMPPFDDPQVRQAFAHATDRDRLVRVYYKGTRAQADGILPPGLPGRHGPPTVQSFDVPLARRLLASSRYASAMPEIVLTVGEGSGGTGEALADMYSRNLGLDVGVRELGDSFFPSLERRTLQFFFTGWIADYPDPEDFLDILFHSNSRGNYGGYSNPQFDAVLEQARIEPDEQRRSELYARAERMLLEDVGAIPIHHEVSRALVRPYVTGLTWSPLGILSYHDVEVGERTIRRAA